MIRIFCNLLIISILCIFACQNNSSQKDKKNSETHDYKCANCGMPAEKYPKWHAKLISEKNEEKWFCSPRCMFIKVKEAQTTFKNYQSLEVVDYYETQFIAAEKAFFVIKSDVIGPMGHDFVPLKDQAAAEEFKKDHQGGKILKFSEINLKTVKEVVNQ